MPESPRRFVISCGVLAVAAAVLAPAGAADAAPSAVFWVSAGGSATHANASCQTAGYSSVQSAVRAAWASRPAAMSSARSATSP